MSKIKTILEEMEELLIAFNFTSYERLLLAIYCKQEQQLPSSKEELLALADYAETQYKANTSVEMHLCVNMIIEDRVDEE